VERAPTTDLRVAKTRATRPAGISNLVPTGAYPERCSSLCLVGLDGCRVLHERPGQRTSY
jgi:hypothetical protein